MFKVIATGKNKNYGLKGQIRLLNDHYVVIALKEDWIEGVVIYVGRGKKKHGSI
jgi:hypothetical protein